MICENCGKEHNGNYGSGRFCCKKCARSFSTKNETNELKEAKCIECGKKIYVNKRASLNKCRCEDCQQNHHKQSDIKTCKICGRTYYKYQGGCQNDFCKQHTLLQFNNLIKFFGFDKSKLGTLEVETEFNRIKENFEYLYNFRNFSLNEIGQIYNYKFPNNLSKIFNYLGIHKRTRIEISKNAILTGRLKPGCSYMFKSEWHTTWNGKEVFLRSSYETDYAKELDEQKIDYDVECLRIKYFDTQQNEYRCAIPDFYIPYENMIVEIKSDWTLDIQNMKDKIKAYNELGYKVKVISEHKEIKI